MIVLLLLEEEEHAPRRTRAERKAAARAKKEAAAKALEEALVLRYGKHVQMLDGDNVRTGLNRDLGFSPADRAESVRRVGEMACLFNGGGVITLVTLVSPYRADRDAVRRRHEDQGLKYLEVFMNVPLDIVQERDPKGLYAKAAAGELKGDTLHDRRRSHLADA